VFACPSCLAEPEAITGSNISVVRHQQGCPVLIEQTRAR